jgi:hypothetical protein
MSSITASPLSLPTHTNTPSSTPQTYLSKCYEQLNLQEANENKRSADMWNLAAKIAPWAFMILAVSGFVATGLFAASYLPFTGIGILFLLGPAYRFSQRLAANAEEPQLRAAMLTEIKNIYDKLPTDPKALADKLHRMGIQWNKIPGVRNTEDLNTLKPLLARYKFWKKEAKQHQLLAKETADAADELIRNRNELKNDSKGQLKLNILPKTFRKASLAASQEALTAKTHAAFTHFALQHPDTSPSTDLYTIQSKSYNKRALERAFNEPDADTLVEFKKVGKSVHNLSVNEVKTDSIRQLAQKMNQAYRLVK